MECEPCGCSGKTVDAINYCETCDEYLCESCTDGHKRSKATKSHQPVAKDLVSGQSKKAENPGKSCEPCLAGNITVSAARYCGDCEEFLCDKCTITHSIQKATKLHQPELIPTRTNILPAHFENDITDSEVHADSDHSEDSRIETVPGRPKAIYIGSDTVTISWSKAKKFNSGDHYQLSIKDIDEKGKWKVYSEEYGEPVAVLTDLKSSTKFLFRVRVVYDEEEGPYSSASEEITTATSYATRLINVAKLKSEGGSSPYIYCLPLNEVKEARNPIAKSRKFEAGCPPPVIEREKTVMLIGATGTGKSTLVDGLINYVLGVNWNDPFRFSVVDLEDEEKEREHNQALSQTEWITCYTINGDNGSRVSYRLNIIDTPGFGDTRGLKRDQEIVEQIRQLYSATGPKGVSIIDAICFLIKAPDARLTAVQSYIFQSVMSLFGKDIAQNICSLITFADGENTPVLAAMTASGLPFGRNFSFNNSGLFEKNVDISQYSLAPIFWEMGVKSFREFFKHIESIEPRSLQLTKDVLEDRSQIETIRRNLQPKLEAGLSKVDQLKVEIKLVQDNKLEIAKNKNFEYEVTITKQKKMPLPRGQHITNCTRCNFTCHANCTIATNEEKRTCSVIGSDGNCRLCPNKCSWTFHANTPYIFTYVQEKERKTYANMQKKYQDAVGKLLTQEQVITKMSEELDNMFATIEDMMIMVNNCNARLAEIALRPNPLSVTEHIDLMIENEKMLKKEGFLARIQSLNEFRKRAHISTHFDHFNKEVETALSAVGMQRKEKQKDWKSMFKRVSSVFGF